MDQERTLHGMEAYRDVYFKIESDTALARFGATDVRELFNGVYTEHIEQGGTVLTYSDMKSDGYFYVPTRNIQGDVIIRRDMNLVDEFEITIIANFLQTTNLRILEESTGNEKYNYQIVGSGISVDTGFSDRELPYYPLMDTVLLGNLWVTAQLGYIQNPDINMLVNGRCVGISPSFRKDGLPLVTYTFRDIGWAMAQHTMSQAYPILAKDESLENVVVTGELKKE